MRPDILHDPPDDARAVVDRRRPPFCYQTIDALAAIRARFSGHKLSTALAIYLTFTEVANGSGGADARADFRATRKQLAGGAGVSPDTLDRYVKDFADAGLVTVIREKVGDVVNLPNRWALLDPSAPPGRVGAAPPSRTGAAQVLEELERKKKNYPTPISPPEIARPVNRPATVNRKPVTDIEYEKARLILDEFNAVALTVYTGVDWIAKIVARLREHPGLPLEAHAVVIRRAFEDPWWTGPPSPSVVYGNAGLFERAVHAVREPARERPMTPEDMEARGA